MRILIVEDHKKINNLMTRFARQDNHQVIQCFSAESALETLKVQAFDLIISDLMLPDMQGEELISTIRTVSDVYIIVVSAKNALSDKLDVLKLGADDYIIKPFSVEELMAKLQNIEKRVGTANPLIHSFYQGEMTLQPMTRQIYLNGQEIGLTAYEYDVLFYLIKNKPRVFSREDIILALFSDSDAYDRVIDVYIKNIRKKLNDDPKNPRYIKTVFREGYQFVGEADD